MKKLFDAIFPQLVWTAIAAMLVATIINPATGFANVALVFIWVVITLCVLLWTFVFLMGVGITLADNQQSKEKLADGLEKCVGKFIKRSAFRKTIDRLKSVIMVGLLGYVGFIWTAVFYALAHAMSLFIVLLSKEALERYDAEKAKDELAAATPAKAEDPHSNF